MELCPDILRDRRALRDMARNLVEYAAFLDRYAKQEIDDELEFERHTGWGFPIMCTRQEIRVHLEEIIGEDEDG